MADTCSEPEPDKHEETTKNVQHTIPPWSKIHGVDDSEPGKHRARDKTNDSSTDKKGRHRRS